MKTLSILGSTGSIGKNALSVVEAFPDRFSVCALTARTNVETLSEQIRRVRPQAVAVADGKTADALKSLLPVDCTPEILHGPEGYAAVARHSEADTVLVAVVGAAGLLPTLAAVDAGKTVAIATKEVLVTAGELVMRRAARRRVKILPVDSEHSAVFQALSGQRRADLDRIILTASGGPFRKTPKSAFSGIRPEDALKHPTWSMGRKITIDSATLMNKGLEVIEACRLFDVPASRVEVVVHPQSIVHSMVAFVDGGVIAQMGVPDMRGAIAYALSYPRRLPLNLPLPDFPEIGSLTFEPPDLEKFPCLALAYDALTRGGTAPAVLNAANEVAVSAFLEKRLSFAGIPAVIRETLDAHPSTPVQTIDDALSADRWGRERAAAVVAGSAR